MPRREDHEVRQGHVGHWIKKRNILYIYGVTSTNLMMAKLKHVAVYCQKQRNVFVNKNFLLNWTAIDEEFISTARYHVPASIY